MKITTNFIKQTKRHFSASGSILLPLALKWRLVAFLASVILAVLVTPCLAPHMAAAASITLTVPNDPLSLTLTPTPEGTFSSTAANVLIKTDALAGYTLSIKAKEGTDLKNKSSTDPKNVITSISSITTVSKNDFRDKADYNNKWGFAFGKGGEGNTFHGLNGTNAVTVGSSTEPNSSNDTYSITLGARVNNELAVGAYSNTFIVVASANPVPYKVTYNDNSSTGGVSNMPSNVTSATTNTQAFAISSQEPTRTGYEFIGWCDKPTTKENNVDVCSTSAYQASDEYDLTAKNQTVTLYAMWVDNSHIMQNWKGCATATLNQQITLVDIRDNREYYVAKLADGNCWMTENLDLFIDKNTTYTVADTDLDHATDDEKAACKEKEPSCVDEDGNYQWKPTESTHETGDMGWNTVRSNVDPKNGGDFIAQSYDAGNRCWDGKVLNIADTNTNSFNSHTNPCFPHEVSEAIESHYHIGNFYSYGAAVAQSNTSAKVKDGDYYDTSICPLGWQLPNNTKGDKSFYDLFDHAEPTVIGGVSGNIHLSPYYLQYGGVYTGGVIRSIGFNVDYRTNAVFSDITSYALFFYGDRTVVYPVNSGPNRHQGFAVRCVSRQ